MKKYYLPWLGVIFLVWTWSGAVHAFEPGYEGCTIAAVSGAATVDGRPLLWKNRDTDSRDNEVVYFDESPHDFLGLVNADSLLSVWSGVNDAGFAILNSRSIDLEGVSCVANGTFMKRALMECGSVAEFEQLLIDTNDPGRATQANYGVIDAMGEAAVFETGNTTYTRFDARDEPGSFIVRTNFAMSGDGTGYGQTRYNRANELLVDAVAGNMLDHPYILGDVARDLVNDVIDPYPLPYEGSQAGHPLGYLRTYYSISRYRTASVTVVHGVLPEEDPLLSTIWCILGEPVCGVAVPLWCAAEDTPVEMDGSVTAPFSDAILLSEQACYTDPSSQEYIDTYALDDGAGGGLLSQLLPIEDWTLAQAEALLADWRLSFPDPETIRSEEFFIIETAYDQHPTSCPDSDDDGHRDEACGWDDCDDTDPLVNPETKEACDNGIDDDCDGLVDGEDPDCLAVFSLDLDALYEGGTLSLSFTLSTPEPATWATYLILPYPTVWVTPLWTAPLPVIVHAIEIPVSFPLPNWGWVGIYTGLFTEEGTQAFDLVWVDTGT